METVGGAENAIRIVIHFLQKQKHKMNDDEIDEYHMAMTMLIYLLNQEIPLIPKGDLTWKDNDSRQTE